MKPSYKDLQNDINHMDAIIEGLAQTATELEYENNEYRGVLQDVLDSLAALPEVPQVDLEEAVEKLAQVIRAVL